MLQKLQNLPKIKKIQLDNLVNFEKCCKTRIYLQRSVPIQPKTSDILHILRRALRLVRIEQDQAKSATPIMLKYSESPEAFYNLGMMSMTALKSL